MKGFVKWTARIFLALMILSAAWVEIQRWQVHKELRDIGNEENRIRNHRELQEQARSQREEIFSRRFFLALPGRSLATMSGWICRFNRLPPPEWSIRSLALRAGTNGIIFELEGEVSRIPLIRVGPCFQNFLQFLELEPGLVDLETSPPGNQAARSGRRTFFLRGYTDLE